MQIDDRSSNNMFVTFCVNCHQYDTDGIIFYALAANPSALKARCENTNKCCVPNSQTTTKLVDDGKQLEKLPSVTNMLFSHHQCHDIMSDYASLPHLHRCRTGIKRRYLKWVVQAAGGTPPPEVGSPWCTVVSTSSLNLGNFQGATVFVLSGGREVVKKKELEEVIFPMLPHFCQGFNEMYCCTPFQKTLKSVSIVFTICLY